jgi:hypothetical protein
MDADTFNPNNPCYMKDLPKEPEACDLCLEKEEVLYPAQLMISRLVLGKVIRFNTKGKICGTCKGDESNLEDGIIIRLL